MSPAMASILILVGTESGNAQMVADALKPVLGTAGHTVDVTDKAAKQVLRGVSLTIGPGESVVIIGRSGTGKSVLLKHVVGLMQPDAGTVLVDGIDVPSLGHDELLTKSDLYRRMCARLSVGKSLDDPETVDELIQEARR